MLQELGGGEGVSDGDSGNDLPHASPRGSPDRLDAIPFLSHPLTFF